MDHKINSCTFPSFSLAGYKMNWITMVRIIIFLFLLLSVVLQVLIGNIEIRQYSFPVNLILGILLIYLLAINRHQPWFRVLSSIQTTLFVIVLMLVNGLILGLFPQLSPHDAQARNELAAQFGFYQFTTSWIFVGSILIFLTVLGAVIFRRVHSFQKHALAFLLSHGGLWLALFAGTFGSADTYKTKLIVRRDEANQTAYEPDGKPYYLPYTIRLQDFSVIRNLKNQDPGSDSDYIRNYEATIEFTKGNQVQSEVISINHPVRFSGDYIYLSGYQQEAGEATPYSIIQVVRQPWGFAILIGILLMFAGAAYLFITGFRAKQISNGLE